MKRKNKLKKNFSAKLTMNFLKLSPTDRLYLQKRKQSLVFFAGLKALQDIFNNNFID